MIHLKKFYITDDITLIFEASTHIQYIIVFFIIYLWGPCNTKIVSTAYPKA